MLVSFQSSVCWPAMAEGPAGGGALPAPGQGSWLAGDASQNGTCSALRPSLQRPTGRRVKLHAQSLQHVAFSYTVMLSIFIIAAYGHSFLSFAIAVWDKAPAALAYRMACPSLYFCLTVLFCDTAEGFMSSLLVS